MRVFLCGGALLALAACAPTVPDSSAGVGFGSYEQYQRRQADRERALIQGGTGTGNSAMATGGSLPPPSSVQGTPLDGTTAGSSEAERLAAETAAALNSGRQPVQASPSNPTPVAVNTAGISQENNFDNVATLRTIESDAERMAANRAQYQVVEPTALPTRVGTGPNIVDFALSTTHQRGQAIYRRSAISGQARYDRNCAQYPSADMAQLEFLSKGGPERDRLGLDPDGDGFACSWDPSPYRKARG